MTGFKLVRLNHRNVNRSARQDDKENELMTLKTG